MNLTASCKRRTAAQREFTNIKTALLLFWAHFLRPAVVVEDPRFRLITLCTMASAHHNLYVISELPLNSSWPRTTVADKMWNTKHNELLPMSWMNKEVLIINNLLLYDVGCESTNIKQKSAIFLQKLLAMIQTVLIWPFEPTFLALWWRNMCVVNEHFKNASQSISFRSAAENLGYCIQK